MQADNRASIKESLLVVDDNEINRAVLVGTFQDEYNIIEAENGKEALDILLQEKNSISAILLDIVMPVMDGFAFLEEFKKRSLTGVIPVFLITADTSERNMYRGYQLGVMDIIEKPIVPYFVKRRVNSIIELFRARKSLSQTVRHQHGQIMEKDEEINKLNYALIETLSTAIELRSGESGSHVKRLSRLTRFLLLELREICPDQIKVTDEEIEQIAAAAIMHDVGKIAISDAILNKPGKLTAEEFEIMKTHTIKGCEILSLVPNYQDNVLYRYAYDICRHHHERWDGGGYPDGLKGDEITIWSQVVSIADVFDALTSERVYKKAFPVDTAVDMIYSGQCGKFNPFLLKAFEEVLKKYDYAAQK